MARPSRDPIEKLKTQMFMRYLCTELKLPLFGPALAEFFDGSRRASSKWKRYIDGEKTPSAGTIKGLLNRITCKFNDKEVTELLTDFWFSPLWKALKAEAVDSSYWKSFYKNMPVRFHKYVFDKNAHFGNSYKRRYPRSSEVTSIEKYCDFDSLDFP
nr:hypothetical protein [Lelliottia steviae]